MKATEIRVGNWVKEESLGYKQWGLKDFDNYHGEHYPENWISDKIEPIPLTSEILEKAGFAAYKFGYWMDRKDIDGFRYDLNDKEFCIVEAIDRFCAPCEHLHQLQNIYFALTGNELQINL